MVRMANSSSIKRAKRNIIHILNEHKVSVINIDFAFKDQRGPQSKIARLS